MSVDVSPRPSAASRDEQSQAPSVWRKLDEWLDAASERLNPILVKETRQALKSQQFLLGFLLLLCACWVVTIGGIAWIGPGVHYAASGGMMFLAYYYILAVALVIVVPFAAYRSLATEQEENTRDVLMVSALSPRQLIDGKIGSAVLQGAIYLSALAPCIAFTYLLRGIDLRTLLLLPTLAVLASLGLSILGLMLSSTTHQRYSQVLTSVAFVAVLFYCCYFCIAAATEAVRQGYEYYESSEFWAKAWGSLTGYACGCLLAYFASISLNTFVSANRSSALRRVLLLTQACFVGWAVGLWLNGVSPFKATYFAWVFWWLAGALLTGEQPVLSERVRRDLPDSVLGRFFLTWFNPGPGTGYLFVVANLATITAFEFWAAIALGSRQVEAFAFLVLGPAYVIAFVGIGRLLILGLRRFAKLSLLGCFLIQFLLQLAGAGFSETVRASIDRFGRLPFTWYDVTSPVRTLTALADSDVRSEEAVLLLLLVPGVAACVLLVNLLLTAREIQQTRTPLPQRVIEDDSELSPATTQVVNPWGDVGHSEA